VSSGKPKDEMPPELVEFLAGGRLVVASTVDADGLPYTMVMNSAVAIDAHTIRFALDRRTHSLKNIEANGCMMFEIIGDGFIFGVRGAARVIREQMEHAPTPSALVEVSVETVKQDLPPGVQVTAPLFEWGPLGAYMTPIEPAMFEELRTYARPSLD
jgi:predicted pyridoxine 5'-phosphate oxidase superfamily flavin-nucleotide-binding protein